MGEWAGRGRYESEGPKRGTYAESEGKKGHFWHGVVGHICHPGTREAEDQEVEASLGYTVSLIYGRDNVHILKTLNYSFGGLGMCHRAHGRSEDNWWG